MRVAKAISVRINYLCLEKNYTFNSLAYSAAISPSTIKNIILFSYISIFIIDNIYIKDIN